MDKIIDFFKNPQIIQTVLTIGVGYIVRTIILKLIHKNIKDTKLYHKVKRIISYTYFTVIFIILFTIWTETSSISTYLGLASAGLAIALKDLLINIAAWLFIMIRKPFVVGDRIEIKEQAGDVIDQRLFQFTVMEIGNWVSNDQSTGRLVHLPNSVVFTDPLANFTSGFDYIWSEVDVLLTFESDFKKAKKLFLDIAHKHGVTDEKQIQEKFKAASKKYMIFYKHLTPIVYTDVKDSGIMLSIRYLCNPYNRRNSIDKIWEDILDLTEAHKDIVLAYNTVRMIRNFD
jgi:small-conductance mechanosensitive channel